MKQDEFCYWLQGHFELNPDAETLTVAQSVMVRSHLELVKQCRPKDRKKNTVAIDGFCAWLDGALDVAPRTENGLHPDSVQAIKTRLGKEFLHVIDPKVPGDKEDLQATHDGLQRPPSTQTWRC